MRVVVADSMQLLTHMWSLSFQVNILMQENQLLNQKVASLTKEFELLKDLYQAHAKYAPSDEPAQEIDLTKLMAPDDPLIQNPQ